MVSCSFCFVMIKFIRVYIVYNILIDDEFKSSEVNVRAVIIEPISSIKGCRAL